MLIEGLRLELEAGIATTSVIDFNRFRFYGVPVKHDIEKSINANRDALVEKWYQCFNNNNEYADRTLHGYIHDFIKFVRVCDEPKINPESKDAVILWERHLVEQVRLNGMKVNSARKLISSIKSILGLLNDAAKSWFSAHSIFRSEINPTKSYSDKELSQLLKLFHSLFRQLTKQILNQTNIHLSANSSKKTAVFEYNGNSIPIAGAVTKCFCLGYYLLSYFTLSNSTTLLKMVKVEKNENNNHIWFEQSVLKPRANKFVSISIGDNGTFHVPKYALRFFENLLKLSQAISPSKHLLFQATKNKVAPLEANHLSTFSKWVQSTFNLKDDSGNLLKPTNRKFRASGSYRYLMLTGSEIETSILLGNTPQVLKRHYSSGNEGENNNQLMATALTLENAVKCSGIEKAKEQTRLQLNLEILPYEDFIGKYTSTFGQRTSIGTACKNPHADEAKKYQRKVNFNPKDFDVQNLACSDITNCFFCKNQVIIENIDDIWCLMSFKESVLDSKEFHLNENQFQKNFSELLNQIELILYKISPVIRRKAETKLTSVGRHPIWPEDINIDF